MLQQYRVDRKIGDGIFIGDADSASGKLFYKLLQEKDHLGLSFLLGWSEGCPVIPKVIKARGTRETAETYAELLNLRHLALDIIKKEHPSITSAFTRPVKRQPNEPAPHEFPEMLNENSLDMIPATEKLLAYDLPRLIRIYWGEKRHQRKPQRFFDALELVSISAKQAKKSHLNSSEFIVHLADQFLKKDQNNAPLYLRRLLSAGKLSDDNQYTSFRKLLTTMRSMSSALWPYYEKLREAGELPKHGIADLTLE
jgi:hypothetical protein